MIKKVLKVGINFTNEKDRSYTFICVASIIKNEIISENEISVEKIKAKRNLLKLF